jgi:transposase
MSIRQTAKNFGVTKATVEYWLNRSKGKRLDRVDWSNKPINVKTANNRVETYVEQCVLTLRKELKEQSPLGEFGADAIQYEMKKRKCPKVPSRATINRILKRNGVLDGKHEDGFRRRREYRQAFCIR